MLRREALQRKRSAALQLNNAAQYSFAATHAVLHASEMQVTLGFPPEGRCSDEVVQYKLIEHTVLSASFTPLRLLLSHILCFSAKLS